MTSDHRVVNVLSDLIALKSVNPGFSGGVGEAAMADHVEHWASGMGFDVVRQGIEPGRENVLVTLAVPGATETLLYEAHMDTVSLEPMGEDGLRPVVRDGRVHGRGACDTKGSLAAMMVAFERLQANPDGLRANVALLASVDEEYAYRGVLAWIASDETASAAVVGEPTDLRVVVAHFGCVRGSIVVQGKAAHSSEPENGINAIDAMADVLVELRALQHQIVGRHHPLLGQPKFTVSLIEGGTGVNVVPATCTVAYDRRTLPEEDPEQVLAEIDAILDRVRLRRPEATITRLDPRLVSEGLDTPAEDDVVQAARSACDAIGIDNAPVGVPYGSDASKLQKRAGIASIVFGPGSIKQAHGADEFVPIEHLATAVAFYEGIARRFGTAR
jgi:acetylornithine deacetylase/succinyl-diaminopimelate desuccinylase-like protein